MKAPHISCPSCKGLGHITLPEPLASTYGHFAGKAKLTAANVFEVEGAAGDVTINAINNRLERLREVGLLKRTRAGRAWLYEKPKPGESTADPEPVEKPAKREKPVRVTPPADAKPAKKAATPKRKGKAKV